MALLLAALALAADAPPEHVAAFIQAAFPDATEATPDSRTLDAAAQERLREVLGKRVDPEVGLHRIARGANALGYVLIDDQLGQHEPITYALAFDAEGTVLLHDVLVYREAFGEGIRDPRFRNQFVGKRHGDGFALGRDIKIVSGATVSSKAMAVGVRRGAAIMAELLADAPEGPSVAAPVP